ncbi:MAG: hypothetical protein A07HN63_01027 [uncultured archaeon A07HN63]|jgi:hypothetical protein|nr:MAG: hypothetical protein A07HN63_01027 [uncultured archaeon A07HN63]
MGEDLDDPMTDEEFAELRAKLEEQQDDILDYLESHGADVSPWDAHRI